MIVAKLHVRKIRPFDVNIEVADDDKFMSFGENMKLNSKRKQSMGQTK